MDTEPKVGLPKEGSPRVGSPRVGSPRVGSIEIETKNKIILIVDDIPDNLRLLSGILKGRGKYKLKAATSGQKALTIVQKLPHPDIVLLDVMMPEMDGYEVCKNIKNNPETAHIPVIFITANKSDEEKKKVLN